MRSSSMRVFELSAGRLVARLTRGRSAMFMRTIFAAATATAGLALVTGSAYAFDRDCDGKAVACYEKVRTPEVYATVARKIVVQPATREVVETPAVYGRRTDRVVVESAHVERVREPAVYGRRYKRVLVRPASVSYEHVPAVVKTVRERVLVSDGGYRWERSRSLLGRERICKVRNNPVYRTVTREVVARPSERVRHVRPALYRYERTQVLLREARTRHVYTPQITAIVNRKVLLKPAERRVVNHPKVVGTRYERVLVRDGGYVWRATRTERGLFDR